jgi:hypothetical protein
VGEDISEVVFELNVAVTGTILGTLMLRYYAALLGVRCLASKDRWFKLFCFVQLALPNI